MFQEERSVLISHAAHHYLPKNLRVNNGTSLHPWSSTIRGWQLLIRSILTHAKVIRRQTDQYRMSRDILNLIRVYLVVRDCALSRDTGQWRDAFLMDQMPKEINLQKTKYRSVERVLKIGSLCCQENENLIIVFSPLTLRTCPRQGIRSF